MCILYGIYNIYMCKLNDNSKCDIWLESPISLNAALLPLFDTRRKEMLYLTAHATHFIYGYMASDIW